MVHCTTMPSVTVTMVGSIVLSLMVMGTVVAGDAPTSVAVGDAASVGDGAPVFEIVPVAEGRAITVGLDAPGAVGLAEGAGIPVMIGMAVSVGVDG